MWLDGWVLVFVFLVDGVWLFGLGVFGGWSVGNVGIWVGDCVLLVVCGSLVVYWESCWIGWLVFCNLVLVGFFEMF